VLDSFSVPSFVKGFSRRDEFREGTRIFQELDPSLVVSVEQTNDLEHVLIYSSSLSMSETYIINGYKAQSVKPRVPGTLYKIEHHPLHGFFRISNEDDGMNFAIYNFIPLNEATRKVIVPAQPGVYLTRMEIFSEYMVRI
jgi:protease II